MRKLNAIFLLDAAALAVVYPSDVRACLAAHVNFLTPPLDAASWRDHRPLLAGVEAVYTGWDAPVMDAALLKYLPLLEVVFHAGGTVKFFVTEEFWERGLRVTCAARVNAVPVAEFAVAHILLSLKHSWHHASVTRTARKFRRADFSLTSSDSRTVGLLSLGEVGRLVAQTLRRHDVVVLAYDPTIAPAEAERLGVTLCPLGQIFERADVVSCHTPLLPETTHLLRAHHFERLKHGATFINTARGAIVEEAELVATLKHRPDLFAVLDVTDPQPPAGESPLYDLPNVLLTPHIAGSLGPECRRLGQMMVDETTRYLRGEPLAGEVRRERLASLA